MGRVLTNDTSLVYGLQADQDTDPTVWFLLEPNAINTFGATITTVARDPISKDKQRRKGVVTDLDSSVEWEGDTTISHFTDFIECFSSATAVLSQTSRIPTDISSDVITIPAITNGDEAFFLSDASVDSLIFNRAYTNPANNGLFALTAAGTTTALTAAGQGLVDETPPANAQVELAGVRPETTSDLSIVVTGASAVLTSAADIPDFSVLGLTVGQFIHLGGITSGTQFTTCVGFARVELIGTTTLTLDKLDSTVVTDTGTGDTVDLLFGRFVRNVPVDNALYLEQFITFEMTFPNLGNPSGDRYQYSLDNLCNTAAFNLPLTDKSTVTFGFVGTDTDNPTDTQKAGAAAAISPNKTAAFGTTSTGLARLQLADLSDNQYGACFKSLTLSLDNQVTPEKCLATLGAQFMNSGNFLVDIESQLLFTEQTIIDAIRSNTTVTLDFRLDNDDGAIVLDIPNMTIGGGDREFPLNESVLINVTGMAFGASDNTYTYSLGSSIFPVTP